MITKPILTKFYDSIAFKNGIIRKSVNYCQPLPEETYAAQEPMILLLKDKHLNILNNEVKWG